MRKLVSFLGLAGLLSSLALQGLVFAQPDLPVAGFQFEKFYSEANYIPDCVTSDSCAIYVDVAKGSDEDSTNDGSRDKPYKTVTKAVDEVTVDKYIIAVAEGTYSGSTGENFPLQLFNDTQILGGFYDGFNSRDNSRGSHKSVLNLDAIGSNGEAETGFEINDAVVVDGFEIRESDLKVGTNSDSGGAMQINVADNPVAITNNTFDSNKAQKGGAIFVENHGPSTSLIVIANNEFKNNESTTIAGGAIYSSGGSLIFNNEFKNNIAEIEGGAIYAGGDTEIVGNLFIGNGKGDSAEKGGAIIGGDTVKIFNNFVVDSSKSSAIYVTGKTKVVNNTVVGSTGHGIQVGAPDVEVVNNLSAYNGGKGVTPLIVSITGWKNENNATWQNDSPSKNTTECDPEFADENSTDPSKLKLGAGSECIDTGQNYAGTAGESLLDVDYFGNARNVDGDKDGDFAVDPGAHEIEGDAAGSDVTKPAISGLSVKGNVDPVVISFDLSETAVVTVTIDDKNGDEVVNLLDAKEKTSGNVKIEWDQKDTAGDLVDYATYTVNVTASSAGGKVETSKDFELTKPDPNAVDDTTTTTTEDTTSSSSGDFSKCAGFSDVLDGAPLCDAIEHVKSQGYFEGYPDGTFGYDKPISRAEVLKVVFLYAGQQLLVDDGTDLGFNDVEKGAWYMTYVRTAKEFGIVEGYPDGSYRPAQAVARNEFLKIFFGADGREFKTDVTVAPYLDVPVSSETNWFIKFVDFVRANSLMDTDRAGNFAPGAPMTRGDVAEFIYRLESAGLQS